MEVGGVLIYEELGFVFTLLKLITFVIICTGFSSFIFISLVTHCLLTRFWLEVGGALIYEELGFRLYMG